MVLATGCPFRNEETDFENILTDKDDFGLIGRLKVE